MSAATPGTTAFIVDAPGKIDVSIKIATSVAVALRGPNGVASSTKGSGTIALSYAVTAADVAKGRVWGLVITAPGSLSGSVDANLQIVHPGKTYTKDQMASLPEAQATQRDRAAALSRQRHRLQWCPRLRRCR